MKKWIRPAFSACFLLLLALQPARSMEASLQALTVWATSVVPALLPFLMTAPALCCPETAALLARAAGGFLRLMRLPKNSTGALITGLLCGSPGGAAALAACPREPEDPPGSFLRAAILFSGASPAFLTGVAAASFLNAPEYGGLLFRSQVIAGLLTVSLLKFPSAEKNSAPPAASAPPANTALKSALTLLTIAVYMTFFSVLGALLVPCLSPSLDAPLMAVLELVSGCRALSRLSAPLHFRLPLVSAAASFGGISVTMQCLSILSTTGVSAPEYITGKLIHAALCALTTHIQLRILSSSVDLLFISSLFPAGLLLFLMLRTLSQWRTVRTNKLS